jgi:hypothetical protein
LLAILWADTPTSLAISLRKRSKTLNNSAFNKNKLEYDVTGFRYNFTSFLASSGLTILFELEFGCAEIEFTGMLGKILSKKII